jgi:very-short-patch-repair endonuclease
VFESEELMNSSEKSVRRSARDPEHIAFARDQRARANEFTQDVWQMVRGRRCRNQKFRREYPIPPYTTDFCCVALKLVVEIDGEHHQTDDGNLHDTKRDEFLAEQGYEVLRISGYQVTQVPAEVRRQIESAIDERLDALGSLTPSPSPSTS